VAVGASSSVGRATDF